jgi:hypothetical protein
MDNAWGALGALVVVLAIIFWVVKTALILVAGAFVMMTGVFGHPLFVVGALGAIGAGVGMIILHRRQGAYVARSSDDYATIGGLRLTPEGWGALVLTGFIVALGLYGLIFLASRAHHQATAALLLPAASSALV